MGRSWLKFWAKSAKGNPQNGALSAGWGEAIFGFGAGSCLRAMRGARFRPFAVG